MAVEGMPTCAELDAVVQRTLSGLMLSDLPLTDEDRRSGLTCGWKEPSGQGKRLVTTFTHSDNPADLDSIRDESGFWESYPPYHTQDFDGGVRQGMFVIRDDSASEYSPGCSTSMILVVNGYQLAFSGYGLTVAQGVSILGGATRLLG